MSTLRKNILNKLYPFVVLMTLFFVVIIIRIIDIQYIQGEKYRKLSRQRTIKNDKIFANRGNVYASDGNLLATSISKYTIRMDVMSVNSKVFEKNITALSQSLSKLLGKSVYYYQQKLRKAKRDKNRYLLIAQNISYYDYIRMKHFPIFKLGVYRGGFITEQKTVRVHPIGKIAERTIGYDDYRGKVGIEGAFSKYMKGQNGSRLKQKMARGQWKPINDVNEKEPIEGHDVITTIDVNIQDVTHHALLKQIEYFKADHGCAIVMETSTGQIKAIANLGRTSKGNYYEKRNYAVWERQEPGSTFKLASLMIALEDKVIDTSTVVDTEKGRIFIHGNKVEDSHPGGYGKITAARVMEVSSNVGIVKLIKKYYDHNPKKFTNKILSFGLNKKTGIKIKGEANPYIPLPSNKQWNKISLEWMAWGYGLLVTPLQMLTFYNAVANNGVLVKPYFVKELRMGNKVKKEFKKQALKQKIASRQTINKVRKILENVVKKGTASNIYSPVFSMAGKTGTAKKVINGKYSNKYYVASFVGFFPVDKPKYSCIVVIDSPKKEIGYFGRQVAAPVFKEIAQKIYARTPVNSPPVSDKPSFLSLNKKYQNYYTKLRQTKLKVPNVKGMEGMDAVALLENIGFNVKFLGIGKVKYQSIKKGQKIVKGSTIILKLSDIH